MKVGITAKTRTARSTITAVVRTIGALRLSKRARYRYLMKCTSMPTRSKARIKLLIVSVYQIKKKEVNNEKLKAISTYQYLLQKDGVDIVEQQREEQANGDDGAVGCRLLLLLLLPGENDSRSSIGLQVGLLFVLVLERLGHLDEIESLLVLGKEATYKAVGLLVDPVLCL